jgi:putative transposase
MRVTRSRELVAEGYRPSAVARVAQISRQAIYRVLKPRRPPVSPAQPAADEVEQAIVDVAEANPTDGYRLVTAWVRRRLRRPVNRKRVLRVMRERRLIQRRRRLDRRRRPGFFRVERPDRLWHLDLTSVWVAEHGWVYLMAAIDCCTREIVAWHLETRCRAKEAIGLIERAATERAIAPGTLMLGTDNGSAFTARAFKAVLTALGIAHRRGGATATQRARRSSSPGSASSRNAASGAKSSRPSTTRGRRSAPTSSTTTTGPTAGSTTTRRERSRRPGTMEDRPTKSQRPEPSTRPGSTSLQWHRPNPRLLRQDDPLPP